MKLGILYLLISFSFLVSGQALNTIAEVKSGRVAAYKGRPTIFINSKPVNPMIYSLTHVYGGRWSWEEIPARNLKNFAEIGFKLFQVDLYFEDIWYRDRRELDIAKAQRQVQGVLDACPDAAVIIRVHVNAPFWWNEANREECTEYANGPVDNRKYGPPFNNEDGDIDRPLRASLASDKWRKEAGEKLKEFCVKLSSTREGNSVAGIHVSGGIYGEWHYWGFINHDPDTGKAMTDYFRAWLKKKYGSTANLQKAWHSSKFTLENATVPDTTERKFTSEGIFRDPQKERRVIDYFISQQEVVADDIEYFCKIVKDNWPRPLIVGVFYGYFHMTFSRQAAGGHLFAERILNSPYIDYLSAPQSYFGPSRNLGGAGHSRGIVESARLHNKLWLDEMDNGEFDAAIDNIRIKGEANPDYVPVLRRSSLHPLTRGTGLWYYDFGARRTSGWWDVPDYLANIRQEKEFFDKFWLNQEYKSEADVLFVFDMESFYHVKNGWTPISENLNDLTVSEAYHAGIVFDNIYLFDLDKVNLNQYKTIVFFNTFKISDHQRSFIEKKVAKNGRNIIWQYMPGYTNGEDNDIRKIESLTGIKVKPLDYRQNPTITITNKSYPSVEFSFKAPVSPLVSIVDPEAELVGQLSGGSEIMIARKKNKEYTSWYSTLPLHNSLLMKEVFRKSGAHIYNENIKDVTFSASGLLWIHSVEGGERNIALKNGKQLKLNLPPKSTTLYNNETGEKIF